MHNSPHVFAYQVHGTRNINKKLHTIPNKINMASKN